MRAFHGMQYLRIIDPKLLFRMKRKNSMLISLLKVIVPLFTVILLGNLCRIRNTVSAQSIEGMKKLVLNVFLPAQVFLAFTSMELTLSTLLIPASSCALCFFAFFVGTLTEKRLGKYGPWHRFLMSSSEPGMLGYALFALLYGQDGLAPIVLVDSGLAIFFFSFFLPRLMKMNAEEGERKSGWQAAAESPILRMLLLGVILNLTGLYDKLMATQAGAMVTDTLSLLAAPVSCLMLFSVGYGMRIGREILRPVIKTSFWRLVAFLPFCTLLCLLLRKAGFGQEYLNALILFSCLPASYLISAYLKGDEMQRYGNTELSLHALVSVLAAILIKAFLM